MRNVLILFVIVILAGSCRDSRIHDEPQWGKHFQDNGIENGCFILRDNNHESIHYYNKERCLERFSPASTFKIFNSLVALDIPKVPNEQFVILWDSVDRGRPEWNRDMNMRDAFKVSNVGYYQELARRIGYDYMQHYLDTANYGNKVATGEIDMFWLNDSLKISADEQLGFIKRLYFNQLPFAERTQRIVRSMMLQEDNEDYKLYYKTGWRASSENQILWVVGFVERIEKVNEHENAMNKSDERRYPYFFAQNFEVSPDNDNVEELVQLRVDILKRILKEFGAIPNS